VAWLWQGYIARGGVTLLTSQWKAGKTTLLSLLLARLKQGGALGGQAVHTCKALVLSEEEPALWCQRGSTLDLEAFVDSLGEWGRPTDFQFDELDAGEGERMVFLQSIVFGNGWLLRLHFRDAKVTLASPIVPGPQGHALPLSQANSA
jgi:hypothetical protein